MLRCALVCFMSLILSGHAHAAAPGMLGMNASTSAADGYLAWGSGVTWNPSDNGGVTLSNGNLTAAVAVGAWRGIRATTSKSSGKWRYQVTIGTMPTYAEIGLGTGASTLNQGGSSCANQYKWDGNSGLAYVCALGVTTAYGSFTTGDVIDFYVNFTTGIAYYAKNGVGMGQAYTGISGTYFPLLAEYGTGNTTANFGATAFTYAAVYF